MITIKDKSKLSQWIHAQKDGIESVKRAFLAFGGLETETVSGRELINKIVSADRGLNILTLAGNDRAEYHETLAGQHQAAVEKGVTNLITSGQAQQADDTQSDWVITRTTTLDYDTVFGKNVARHQYTATAINEAIVQTKAFTLPATPLGLKYNYSLMIRNNGGNTALRLRAMLRGGAVANASVTKDITITSSFALYFLDIEIDQDDRTSFDVLVMSNSAVAYDIVAGLHMPIESAYPVLFTEGSRPAPLVQVPDFLPPTGYVGWCGRMVRAGSGAQQVFASSGNLDTEASLFYYRNDLNRFDYWIFGRTGGQLNTNNPFTWANYEYKDIIFLGSWNASNLYLWLCDTDGNLYGYSTAHAINTDTNKTIYLGSASGGTNYSSLGTANLKSNHAKVLTTAELAKDAIEKLTEGSYDLKIADITMQNVL